MIIYSKNIVFYETIKPAFLEIESGKIKRVIEEIEKIIYYYCITLSFLSVDRKRRFKNEQRK